MLWQEARVSDDQSKKVWLHPRSIKPKARGSPRGRAIQIPDKNRENGTQFRGSSKNL